MKKNLENSKVGRHFQVTIKQIFPGVCSAFGFMSKNYPFPMFNKTSGRKGAQFLIRRKMIQLTKIIMNEKKEDLHE